MGLAGQGELASVLLRTIGAGAFRTALGPALVLMIIGSVLLGGVGIPIPMLGQWFVDSPLFRSAALVIWALLFLPAAREALAAKGARYLMHLLPGQRLRVFLSLAVLMGMTMPAALLVSIGGGLGAALLCSLWVVALQVVLAPSWYDFKHRGLQAVTAGALVGGLWGLSSGWLLGAVLAVLAVAISPALRNADQQSLRGLTKALWGRAWQTLVLVHWLRLWRTEQALLIRMGIVLVIGIVLMSSAWPANRGEGWSASLQLALAMQTPFLGALAMMLALLGASSLRDLEWILRSAQVRPSRALGTVWALSFLLLFLASTALALATLPHQPPLWVLGLALCFTAHGAALGAWSQWLCHGPLSGLGAGGSKASVLMFGLTVIVTIAISMVGMWGVFVELLSVPILWLALANRRDRYA